MRITLRNPGGISPKVLPELLAENMAQVAENVVLWSGGCASLTAPVTVATPTKTGVKKTIYKFGNLSSDAAYWFSWTDEVHAVRGPIADTEQKTYFTGAPGGPQKTNFSLATGSGTSYPVAAYKLGVPAPTTPPWLSLQPVSSAHPDDLLRGVLSVETEYLGTATTRFPFPVTFKVYRGLEDETSLWTITATASEGLSFTASAGNSVATVTALSKASGTIKFVAKRPGVRDISKTFTLAKTSNVANNKAYGIALSAPVIQRNLDASYSPASITANLRVSDSTVSGSRVYGTYAGRLVVYAQDTAGVLTEVYRSAANESSASMTIEADDVLNRAGYRVDVCAARDESKGAVETDATKILHSVFVPVSQYNFAGSVTIVETRAYVITNVTAWGEESAPSPAVTIVQQPGTVVRVSIPELPPSGEYAWAARRIYRTVTSAAAVDYYFVGEVALSATEFVDNVDIAAVGEPLPSLDWDEPPEDLSGLIALPSGALCGFSPSLKCVCFSAIGLPYAWPQKYRKQIHPYDPVALAPMGQGVIVLTNGAPYFINSGDPADASATKLETEQACVSSRSVVAFAGGVAYASPDGLVLVQQSGVNVPTMALISRDQWQERPPSTLFAALFEQRYYGFYDNGGGFIFDPASNQFVTHTINATAAHADTVTDTLYIAAGADIKKWAAGAALTHRLRSKVFQLPMLTTLAAARVLAHSYTNLTLNIYTDGALACSLRISGRDAFKLPPLMRTQRIEIELVGTDTWYSVSVASSIVELKND